MVNLLIADDNIHYATFLMNSLNKSNNNIKVCYIAKDGKETIDFINNSNNIDVILLDLKMPIYNGNQVLELIEDKEKYKDSCIIISAEIDLIRNLYTNDIIHSVLYKTIDINEVTKKINELACFKEEILANKKLRDKIVIELLYLGFDIANKGTIYFIDAIEYVALNQDKNLENLKRDIYPKIALKYKDSIHNVKCNINRANNNMYCQCKIERLKEYFCFVDDEKPKVKTVINTILNKIL